MSVISKACAATLIAGGLALGVVPAVAATPADVDSSGSSMPQTGSAAIDSGIVFLCSVLNSVTGSATGSAGSSSVSIPGCS